MCNEFHPVPECVPSVSGEKNNHRDGMFGYLHTPQNWDKSTLHQYRLLGEDLKVQF